MRPSIAFYLVFIGYVLFPMIYIATSDFYSQYWYHLSIVEYRSAAKLGLFVTIVFIIFFTIGLLSAKFFPKKSKKPPTINNNSQGIRITKSDKETTSFYILKYHKVIFLVSIASAILIWISFFGGGYKKIFSLGQNIDKMDFRLLGSDGNRVITALLQIARRLTLPFGFIYLYLLSTNSNIYGKKTIYFLFISLIIGVLTTLDRGPLMMILIMIFYIKYCSVNKPYKVFLLIPILIIILILFSGNATFIQHNIQDYDLFDVIETGTNFLINRAILAPNFVPIELSYGIFDFDSEKLLLKYSRLTALITGAYIGANEQASLFVGPVGAIADIWRNLGILGIIIISYFLGIYFSFVNILTKNSDPITQIAISFTVITLIFYFVYGTFFSQGVFLQLFFIVFVLKVLKLDGQKRVIL